MSETTCGACDRKIVHGFVDYSDTPGWVHADNDEALCNPLDEDSDDAWPATADNGRATLTSAIVLTAVATIGAAFVGSWVAQAAAMLGGAG